MTRLWIDRRTLLIAAISTVAGVSVPGVAPAQDPMRLDEARKIIGDEYRTFAVHETDRKMGATDIRDLVSGNTLYGVLYDDEPYILALNADGTGSLRIADRPRDTGRWWIEPGSDTIHSKWETAAGGEELVNDYYETGTPGLFKTITAPKNRWSMFVMEPGIADI